MKKKLLAILLCGALSFTLFACDKTEEAQSTETTDETADSAESKEDTDATDETAVSKEDVDYVDDYSYGLTDDGYVDGVKATDYVELPKDPIEVHKSEIEPDSTEIDQMINDFINENLTIQDVEKEIEEGDTVNIDYIGTVDGKEFEGGNTNGAGVDVTAGSSDYVDDFLTQIIGHKAGDVFDIEVTFPKDYSNADLAGKDAVFKTTINYVKVAPKFDDELVAEHKDEFRNYFMNDEIETADDVVKALHDTYYDYNLSGAIYNYLYKNIEVKEMPKKLLDVIKNSMELQMYDSYGVSFEEYSKMYGYEEGDTSDMINDNAKMVLIYQAIAEENNFKVSDDDIKNLLRENVEESLEKYGRGYLAQNVLYNKGNDLLGKNAKIIDDTKDKTTKETTAAKETKKSK